MSLEGLQAQAGHRSIVSTRLYLHLGPDWLAEEYRRAAEVIDAQAAVGVVQRAPWLWPCRSRCSNCHACGKESLGRHRFWPRR
jgi:hypothetical protein